MIFQMRINSILRAYIYNLYDDFLLPMNLQYLIFGMHVLRVSYVLS